jgi:hypothetical protein
LTLLGQRVVFDSSVLPVSIELKLSRPPHQI